jgi:hypothetical protein
VYFVDVCTVHTVHNLHTKHMICHYYQHKVSYLFRIHYMERFHFSWCERERNYPLFLRHFFDKHTALVRQHSSTNTNKTKTKTEQNRTEQNRTTSYRYDLLNYLLTYLLTHLLTYLLNLKASIISQPINHYQSVYIESNRINRIESNF